MRLYDMNGRLTSKNVAKYAINWDGKCRSIIQFKVKQFLKPFWQAHICYEEFPCFGSLLKVDLLNASLKIAIEVNGKQHESFNSFFHRGNPALYLKGFKNDIKKSQWLEANSFQLIEITEDEVPLISKEFFLKKFDIML